MFDLYPVQTKSRASGKFKLVHKRFIKISDEILTHVPVIRLNEF